MNILNNKKRNSVARSLSNISIITAIIGFITGLVLIFTGNGIGILLCILAPLSSFFIYSYSELIQLLEDLKQNNNDTMIIHKEIINLLNDIKENTKKD